MSRSGYCSDEECFDELCITECECGRGGVYPACRYRSCYECFTDRASDYVTCIFCGRWHSPAFDTCFKCRPSTQGRDDPASALRQLILMRDRYTCRNCGAREGDMQVNPRLIRPACTPGCSARHSHRPAADDGSRHATLQVDHIVPCKSQGTADEWNLQVLCGICNISKGAIWYVGCRYEAVKTRLCRGYFLIARTYFIPEVRDLFCAEVAAFRLTGTWDPVANRSIKAKGAA